MKVIVLILFVTLCVFHVSFGSVNVQKSKLEESIQAHQAKGTVSVEQNIEKTKKKKASVGFTKNMVRVNDEKDALKHLESQDEQTYFASFDATALSTNWVQIGSIARENDNKVIEIEKAKKAKEQGYIPEPSNSYASVNPKYKDIPEDADIDILSKLSTKEPNFTEDQKKDLISLSSTFLMNQNIWQRLDASNAMSHLHQPQPMIMWLLCDCPLDGHVAKAVQMANTVIKKRSWQRLFHFVYISAQAQTSFDLNTMYKLDSQIINVGACTDIACMNANSKSVKVLFEKPFSTVPRDLTVAITNECCGDKFHMQQQDITAEGFTLEIKRTETNTKGWGQPLKARWHVENLPWTPMNGVPALLLDNIPLGIHTEKYKFPFQTPLWIIDEKAIQRTSTDIIKWMEAFLMGSLKPVIRSEPIPMVQSVQLPLMNIVGHNFESEVLTAEKDVLVFIYSPFCPASRAVNILLDNQIAPLLRQHNVENLVIAKLDKTVNDMPYPGITIARLPLILFFPAKPHTDEDYAPLDYSDFNGTKQPHNPLLPHSHYTKELLLKFIKNHTLKTNWKDLAPIIDKYQLALYHDQHNHNHDHKH